MRLKEDSSSYRSSGLVRRDFRALKNGPQVPPHKRKRNGARCKYTCFGKPGWLHQWEWHEKHRRQSGRDRIAELADFLANPPPRNAYMWLVYDYLYLRCSRCGREDLVRWPYGD